MKLRIFKSVFFKIGVLCLGICMMLVILLFGYLSYKVTKNENSTKELTATLSSQNVLDKIDRNFYERFGDVQAFAYNKLAKNYLKGDQTIKRDLKDFINTMTSYYVLYDVMALCDRQGIIQAVNTQDKSGYIIDTKGYIGKNVSGEPWFQACINKPGPEGGAWYSKFQADKEVGTIYNSEGWGMGFAAPVKDDTGSVIGVWYNYASWKEITQSIRNDAEKDLEVNNPGAFIIITRNTGEIIDASDKQLISDDNILKSDLSTDQTIYLGKRKINTGNYIIKTATAKGAYTYKGRNWKAVTFIPKTKIGMSTIFSKDLSVVYITVLILLLVSGFIIYQNLNNSVIRKLQKMVSYLERQAKGEIVEIENGLKSENEIGKIAFAMDKMASNIKRTAIFAERIGNGELNSDFKVESESDILGISLLNMRKKLLAMKAEEAQRKWSAEGLAMFADIVRRNTTSRVELADVILKSMIQYLEANQGMIYIEENNQLKLIASYAWDRKKYLNKTILPGEGLAGQVFMEKETIFVTDIPEDYVRIKSGIGDAHPTCILVVPLIIEEEILGIIELASFCSLPPYKVNFVEKAGEIIASTLKNTQIAMHTRKLLHDSQMMEEQLRAQEEEMRQNMEELNATQEELKRREAELIRELENYKNSVSDKFEENERSVA